MRKILTHITIMLFAFIALTSCSDEYDEIEILVPIEIVKTDTLYIEIPSAPEQDSTNSNSNTVQWFSTWNWSIAPGTASNEIECFRTSNKRNDATITYDLTGTYGARLELLYYYDYVLVYSTTSIVDQQIEKEVIINNIEFNSIRMRIDNTNNPERATVKINNIKIK